MGYCCCCQISSTGTHGVLLLLDELNSTVAATKRALYNSTTQLARLKQDSTPHYAGIDNQISTQIAGQ
jgi:hypothetical protein